MVRYQASSWPQKKKNFISTGLNELNCSSMCDALSRFPIDFNNLVTNVNSAVFDGRTVLGETQDEEPHVVLLPAPEAEAKAPGASLQLHWVTAKALIVPTAYDRDRRRVGLRQVLVVRPGVSVRSGDVLSNLTFCGASVPRHVVGL